MELNINKEITWKATKSQLLVQQTYFPSIVSKFRKINSARLSYRLSGPITLRWTTNDPVKGGGKQ